ncbi:MAG: hypothetical protein ACP5O1_12120 [Phycisphaerae bacterium]
MRTTRKRFDCVAMKRRGAERIYRRLRGKSLQEQVAYWKERSEAFHREQVKIVGK